MRGITYSRRARIEWNGDPGDSIISLHQIEGIADIIFERLSTRPSIPFQTGGTARTLPDDFGIDPLELRSFQDVLQPKTNPSRLPKVKGARLEPTEDPVQVESNELAVRGLDDYLRDLDLVALSEEEKEYACLCYDGHAPALPRASGHTERVGQAIHAIRDFTDLAFDAARLGAKFQKVPGYSTTPYRRIAPDAFRLSRRLRQLSTILMIAAQTIRGFPSNSAWQALSDQFFMESAQTLGELDELTARLSSEAEKRSSSRVRRIFFKVKKSRWKADRDCILHLIDRVDSLKSTFDILLQSSRTYSSSRD